MSGAPTVEDDKRNGKDGNLQGTSSSTQGEVGRRSPQARLCLPPMRGSTARTGPPPTWMELPTATPSDRSILFFMATTMAVMCSQALPAMGSTMSPTKPLLSPVSSLNSSIDPVRYLQGGRRAAARQLGGRGGGGQLPTSCRLLVRMWAERAGAQVATGRCPMPHKPTTHSEHTATVTVMAVRHAMAPTSVMTGSSSSSSSCSRATANHES